MQKLKELRQLSVLPEQPTQLFFIYAKISSEEADRLHLIGFWGLQSRRLFSLC